MGHGPESNLPFPGRMHVLLFSFPGANAKLVCPMNGNSWLPSVSPSARHLSQCHKLDACKDDKDIPPSARPPHENRMTVSPACRLLSKLMQPWVCRRDRVSQHGSLHQRFIQMVLPMR